MKITLLLATGFLAALVLTSCSLPYRFDVGGGSSETTLDFSPSPDVLIQELGLGLFAIRVEGKKGASFESIEEAFESKANELCHWGYSGNSKVNLKVRGGFSVHVAKGKIKCHGYD